jgi:hypothetical protein
MFQYSASIAPKAGYPFSERVFTMICPNAVSGRGAEENGRDSILFVGPETVNLHRLAYILEFVDSGRFDGKPFLNPETCGGAHQDSTVGGDSGDS